LSRGSKRHRRETSTRPTKTNFVSMVSTNIFASVPVVLPHHHLLGTWWRTTNKKPTKTVVCSVETKPCLNIFKSYLLKIVGLLQSVGVISKVSYFHNYSSNSSELVFVYITVETDRDRIWSATRRKKQWCLPIKSRLKSSGTQTPTVTPILLLGQLRPMEKLSVWV
jgi:hypothetical protein